MNPRFALLVAATLSLSTIGTSAQRINTQELLARAAAYLRVFVERFSNVVAEERYVQDSKTFPRSRPRGVPRSTLPASGLPRHIELTSDFLLVASQDDPHVMYGFRDVFAVNGEPVRDREDRLTKLFLQRSATALEQAHKISAEGARYNLVGASRTLNNPLVALGFLQAIYQPRFRFSLRGTDAELGPDVWVLEYKEETRPTLLRLLPDDDLVAKGRVWIEGGTGRVLKTELSVAELDTIVTFFRFDDRFQIAVPFQMREDFWMGNEVIAGVATYDQFRRFNVRTEEEFREPSDRPPTQ